MGPELQGWGKTCSSRSFDALKSVEVLLAKVEADDTGTKEVMNAGIETLILRAATLRRAHFANGELSEQPRASSWQEHLRLWNKFIQDEDGPKKKMDASKNVEPYHKLFTMRPLSEVLRRLEDVVVTSVEEVKSCKSDLREIIAEYNGLIGRVTEQVSRMKTLFNKKRADLELAAKKKQQQEDQENKKGNAKIMAKAKMDGRLRSSNTREHSIHKLKHDGSFTVLTIPMADYAALKELKTITVPVLIPDCHINLSPEVMAAMDDFEKEEFKTSTTYST